ncbi:hypothetical protein MKZ38_008660 [Zalerion maritima]|uniref:Uncharacterized protein n=1 Tax=Zalerion maritima TaxID=339359 RepID=A0AAD5WME4_9PEZI|nr:hypothetical protein MKZ38_008660 [Zalerion maritima]
MPHQSEFSSAIPTHTSTANQRAHQLRSAMAAAINAAPNSTTKEARRLLALHLFKHADQGVSIIHANHFPDPHPSPADDSSDNNNDASTNKPPVKLMWLHRELTQVIFREAKGLYKIPAAAGSTALMPFVNRNPWYLHQQDRKPDMPVITGKLTAQMAHENWRVLSKLGRSGDPWAVAATKEWDWFIDVRGGEDLTWIDEPDRALRRARENRFVAQSSEELLRRDDGTRAVGGV